MAFDGGIHWPLACPLPLLTSDWTLPFVVENCHFDCSVEFFFGPLNGTDIQSIPIENCTNNPIPTVILTWTPPVAVDVPDALKMLSTMISSIAYGIVLYLYMSCLQALFDSRSKYSRKRRWFLLSYITVMLFLSTTSIIEGILIPIAYIFGQPDLPFFAFRLNHNGVTVYSPLSSAFPFIIWGADAFMMWRCAVLYQGISRISRGILLGVLSSLFMVSLAFGSMTIAFFHDGPTITNFYNRGPLGPQWILVLMSVSAFFNTLLSTLIVLRIRYHQSYIQKALGTAHGKLYNRVIIICVESCALIAALEIIYLILSFQKILDGLSSEFAFDLFPQICVISPLLMVYRVASGMEATTTINLSQVVDAGIDRFEREIYFRTLISTHDSQEV